MNAPPLILCVDDDPAITEMLRLVLHNTGCDVVTAACVSEAIFHIRARRPDLILLDLMLPDVDGFSLCEILRSDTITASIPVVMLTGWASDEARQMGRELGAVGYVTKPFNVRDLVSRVHELVGLPRPKMPAAVLPPPARPRVHRRKAATN